jgi:hypothetical protein
MAIMSDVNARYRQLVGFSKMMCPMRRVMLPGISSDDTAVAEYLASVSEDARKEISDYVLDSVGCCPWPAIPEPTGKEAAERASFDDMVREGFAKLVGS